MTCLLLSKISFVCDYLFLSYYVTLLKSESNEIDSVYVSILFVAILINFGEGLEESLNLFAALIISAAKMSPYYLTVMCTFSLNLDAFHASNAVIPTMVV